MTFKNAVVVQLGERQTEDLDVAGSSPAHGILLLIIFFSVLKFYFYNYFNLLWKSYFLLNYCIFLVSL